MSTFKFECPVCGQHLSATEDQVGISAPCPACETLVTIPPAPSASTPPPPLPPPPYVTPARSPASSAAPGRNAPISLGLVLRRLFGTPILFLGGVWASASITASHRSRLLGEFGVLGPGYYIGLFLVPVILLLLGLGLILWPQKNRSTAFGNLLIIGLAGFVTVSWHFWLAPMADAHTRQIVEENRRKGGLPPRSAPTPPAALPPSDRTARIAPTPVSANTPKVYDNSATAQRGEPRFKITPPADWLQKRVASSGAVIFTNRVGDAAMMINLVKLPAGTQLEFTEAERQKLFSKEAMVKMIPPKAAVVQHAMTALDFRFAGMMGYVARHGEVMEQTLLYAVPLEGYMLTIACTVTGLANNPDAVSQKRLQYLPLMQESVAALDFLRTPDDQP